MNKHYIVATDCSTPGDAIIQVAQYINERQEEYPDISFSMTGAIHKETLQWFPPTNEDDFEPFDLEGVTELIVYMLQLSPFGTTDEDVTAALASRDRAQLKMAYQHMQWLYTTAGVNSTNLNIWCDSIFEGELTQAGITNITTEYESDPRSTYMVEISSQD